MLCEGIFPRNNIVSDLLYKTHLHIVKDLYYVSNYTLLFLLLMYICDSLIDACNMNKDYLKQQILVPNFICTKKNTANVA